MAIQFEYFLSDKTGKMTKVILVIVVYGMSQHCHSKFTFFQVTSKFLLVEEMLTQILLTFSTFIDILSLGKVSNFRRWFLFSVSYFINV